MLRPVLNYVWSFIGCGGWGEFLLHAPCSNPFHRLAMGSLSYTPRAGTCLVVRRVGTLTDTPCPGLSQVVRRVESLYYMPRAGIFLVHKRLVIFS